MPIPAEVNVVAISRAFGNLVPSEDRTDEPCWYACYTRGRHERIVATSLDRGGIESFLPVHTSEVQWSDRKKRVTRPLFPSYVLARFRSRDLAQILRTTGLVTVVRTGKKLVAIPGEEIENVRRFVAAITSHSISPEPEPFVVEGTRVRLCAGPLMGVEGMVVERRGRTRVLVGLKVVGQGLAVDVNDAALQVIG